MSDLPTDDVEELEAYEVEDEEEEEEEEEVEAAPTAESTRTARRQARQRDASEAAPPRVTASMSDQDTAHSLEFLHDVEMDVTVELGRAKRTVRDLLDVQVGSVIELDRAAGSPVDVLVNNRLIARGEVVVVDDEFAIRITEIFDTTVGGRPSR